MSVGGLAAGLAAALVLLPGSWLVAQQPLARVAGRVVRIQGADTIPRALTRVVLHRVGRQAQGPIDSTLTGGHGEFRFRFPPDTAGIYLLSSGFAGIEYFSTPLRTDPAQPDTGLIIVVSDTSSRAVVGVDGRHLVVSRPAQDGTRAALEIVTLSNPGPDTRVAPDSGHPSWAARIPAGAFSFQAGSGDFSADALSLRGDSVLLFAPVAPGEKQVVYSYKIPAGAPVKLPVTDSVPTFTLLLEESDRSVRGGTIARADTQQIEGRTFVRWSGAVPSGGAVSIDFPQTGGARWLLPLLVGLLGMALVLGAARVLRRPAPSAAAPLPARAEALVDALAALDARYTGREAELGDDERARYRAERARLKADLGAALADRGGAA